MHTRPAWLRKKIGTREVVPTGLYGKYGHLRSMYRKYRKMGYSEFDARRQVIAAVFICEYGSEG